VSLTPLGLGTALAAVVLYTAGAAAGYAELAMVAAACGLAVLTGLVWMLPRPVLEVRREIAPSRVARDDAAVAVVTLLNTGTRPRSGMRATDVCGGSAIGVDVPALPPGASRTVTYRLPTARRGEVSVGPLGVVRTDPLGMARRVHRYGGRDVLLVRPRVHPLPLLPLGRARHLEGSTSDRSPAGTVTFHALREYVPGDDLRHVHWRTTARTGSLMIRQLVDASRPESTVVLDLRPDAYGGPEAEAAFELAVDAAASIAVAAARHGFPVAVLTSAGPLLTARDGAALLDRLAYVRPDPGGGLGTAFDALRRSRAGGLLAIVTGRLGAGEQGRVAALRRRFDRVVVVRPGTPQDGQALALAGVASIDAPSAEALVAGWRREAAR
jgi:uncharacterized protein (DUF58 family)